MNALVTGPLAAALEAGRAPYNALFAQARHAAPALEAAAFADHLRLVVTPIIDAVYAAAPVRGVFDGAAARGYDRNPGRKHPASASPDSSTEHLPDCTHMPEAPAKAPPSFTGDSRLCPGVLPGDYC
jgi:hypothetical protein